MIVLTEFWLEISGMVPNTSPMPQTASGDGPSRFDLERLKLALTGARLG